LAALFSPQKPPKVIMLPNEVFALACRAYYDEQGLIVDETNGEFAHCPLPKGMGDKGYYLLHEHHQQQGLLQSRDVGRRCFWSGDVKKWLLGCNYWPDNFFDLWDIYEEFATDTSQLHTDEVRKKRSESFKKAFKEGRKKVNLPLKPLNRRAVEVTFPNGKIGVFPSRLFAAMYVGCTPPTVGHWIEQGGTPRGKNKTFKGYSARYV
jgi:hypothetical protein